MKFRFLILLVTAAFLVSACSGRHATPSAPRAPSVLEVAEQEFRSGNYEEAARQYERYVDENPSAPDRDRAMFRAGLSYAMFGPEWWVAARLLFEKLGVEYPNSAYAGEAGFILRLRAELDSASATLADREALVKKLNGELERLRKIDSERRRIKPPE